MDETAIFKISYGLFFVSTSFEGRKNACVVNTVAQVTQEPLRVSLCMLKTGLTHEMIQKSGHFCVSVIGRDSSLEEIAHFGQLSGRDTDKFAGRTIQPDCNGDPVLAEGCIAALSCNVIQEVDLGTHTLFIADLADAKNLSDALPMTYADYRILKSGGRLDQPETKQGQKWQCSICHYVYDGDIPFEDLPDDYICPICKKPKSAFVKV